MATGSDRLSGVAAGKAATDVRAELHEEDLATVVGVDLLELRLAGPRLSTTASSRHKATKA